ncbi:hypothetical protein B9N43_13075 [Denitratisoma sp. DHT3]|uniref:DUF3240 family protein n=1 Tax=Denitratisoma sp. DHT3 TaxID=1981880 RepID=UPI0011985CFF|nr:DUF3240 family protein [Denitratisoma sp. DHT3]QDX82097.1 hypothetical protein B9N43_13075 [Denitratisoma sp. DHT3]
MRPDSDACLKLILPRALEEQVVEFLLHRPQLAGAFVACAVDGHGSSRFMVSAGEEVRGRTERVKIEILTREDMARELVQELRALLPDTNVSYWITAVLAAGSFS